MTSKADKMSLETELAAHENNSIFTLTPGDQTYVAPYSTDRQGKCS